VLPYVSGSPSENTSQAYSSQINVDTIIFTTIGFIVTLLISIFAYVVSLTLKITEMKKEMDLLLPFKSLLQEYGIAPFRKLLKENATNENEDRALRPK
jgi:uncharacterized protein YacL